MDNRQRRQARSGPTPALCMALATPGDTLPGGPRHHHSVSAGGAPRRNDQGNAQIPRMVRAACYGHFPLQLWTQSYARLKVCDLQAPLCFTGRRSEGPYRDA
ncbi:hypothetical protein GCM10010324_59400 [Streptomyces hiroshimensis]|uniref:Uncharacterized protein n=1 Tax=Streptomyces hiroshimensis TaxID=66424 RepID=A0ABQ2Z4J0_9ACTN|nr:hypothetical protein GCM10010324_59400 [Streptomyces hiroshimensis]